MPTPDGCDQRRRRRDTMSREPDLNVVGGSLLACSIDPMTGLLPGRLLRDRARGHRQPYRLLDHDRRVSRVQHARRQRSVDTATGMGLSRALARGPLVSLCGSLARGLPRRLRPGRCARCNPRPGARRRSDRSPHRARVPGGPGRVSRERPPRADANPGDREEKDGAPAPRLRPEGLEGEPQL